MSGVEVYIRNLSIDFPFEPYSIQRDYMEKIVECLQNRENGVLESPTGTGKTLSLLCSSLAWLCSQKALYQLQVKCPVGQDESCTSSLANILHKQTGSTIPNNNDNIINAWNQKSFGTRPPRVVYASRTHSQLNQVMLELKKTAYRHVKVGVLGSRDQLCIHETISKEQNTTSRVQMCKMLISSRSCVYYNNTDKKVQEAIFQEDRLVDIEDLVKKGRKTQCCPYYASRFLQESADILFAPYNYLLDAKTRRAQDVKLQNDVVIFDEAHNIEKVCEESSSSKISSTIIATCIGDVTLVMNKLKEDAEHMTFTGESNGLKDFTAEELVLLKTIFLVIEKEIDTIDMGDQKSRSFPGSYIFKILECAQITVSSIATLLETLNKVIQFLTTTSDSQLHQKGATISKFCDFLEIVFNSLGPQQSQECTDLYFKLHVTIENVKNSKGSSSWTETGTAVTVDVQEKILYFWCFSPAFGMRSLQSQGVHCMILTSGTLSPLAATISEVGIPIKVHLSNDHIITRDQIAAVVVGKGPTNTEMKCVYENRTNQKYVADLGQTCLNFYRIIPRGVLVFFPSYPFLKYCVDHWRESGIWNKMASVKSIFVEPQNKDELKSIIDQYYQMIDERISGASLLAVCRGKVSEGLDFADARARAVIVIGLPYPPFNDPKVMLKKEYLNNSKRKNLSCIDGNDWYQLEAIRAVNQAVGRVIRHGRDHGAIILCDCRFAYSSNVKSLSRWLQPHIVSTSSFGQAFKIVTNFFKTWKETIPTSASLSSSGMIIGDSSGEGINAQPNKRVLSVEKLAISLGSTSKNRVDLTALYKMSEPCTCGTNDARSSESNKSFGSILHRIEDCLEAEMKNTRITNAIVNENIRKREYNRVEVPNQKILKKRKLNVVPIQFDRISETEMDMKNFVLSLQNKLSKEELKNFKTAISNYKDESNYDQFISFLNDIFLSKNDDAMRSLYKDVPLFLKTEEHKQRFRRSLTEMGLSENNT